MTSPRHEHSVKTLPARSSRRTAGTRHIPIDHVDDVARAMRHRGPARSMTEVASLLDDPGSARLGSLPF
jgi:hypothetical protein